MPRIAKPAIYSILLLLLILICIQLKKTGQLHLSVHATTGSQLWIYGINANPLDDLQTNPLFIAQSWYNGSNVINRYNTTPVYTGTHSLSFTVSTAFDEMDLYTTTPIDISQYQYLTFFATPTQAGQRYGVWLLNAYKQRIPISGQYSTSGLPFSDFGGVPVVGVWNVYDFPISAFNAGTTTIHGIGIADLDGGAQPPIYLDDIALSTVPGEDIQPSAAPATPLPTLPTATPTPPYYPDISPWVYIIPGIVIFLAIFFE